MNAFRPTLYRIFRQQAMSLIGVATWIVLGSSCIARPTEPPSVAPTTPPIARPAPEPPLAPQRRDGRLPTVAVPLHYDLSLEIDPRLPRFFGTTKIALDITEPTFALFMHGENLSIRSVAIRVGSWQSWGRYFSRSEKDAGTEELVFAFPRELPKGPAELTVVYDASFATPPEGLFRVQEGARWYAFTQFEACRARRAFPSFDEPSFKVSFDVTVTVPAGMTAFSNMPEASRAEKQSEVQFKFVTTPPLPTYLIAVAVGEFDVEVGPSEPVPIRIVRVKDKPGDSRLPLELAHRFIGILAETFAYPHPFPKLDLLAVPQFFRGGMENPGLIAFQHDVLLLEREKAPAWKRRWLPELIAHELVHQWFGNLVTPRWWDDVWLSEGFADFFATRAVDSWRPSWGARSSRLSAVDEAMEDDALPTSKAVRRSVVTPEDAEAVLRGYVREKTANLLQMIERFVGEETFRQAIRRYLRDHAWRNVTTEDLVSSLEMVSGKPLSTMVHAFLDQPGVPELSVTTQCNGAPSMSIEQEPFRLPEGDPATPAIWGIPFCGFAWKSSALLCQPILTKAVDLPLDGTPAGCPTFFDPNPGQNGYYRYRVSAEQLDSAARIAKGLGVDTKFGLLSNAWTTVEQRRLQPDALLRFLPALDKETDPILTTRVTRTLDRIRDAFVAGGNERLFNRYAAARLAGHKARLGLGRSNGLPALGRHGAEENDLDVEARVYVALTLGELGDEDVLAAAAQRTRQWINQMTADVDPDASGAILGFGARRADAGVFEQLAAEIERSAEPTRALVLLAIGHVEDPPLVRRALDLTLRPMLSNLEVSSLFWRLAARPVTRQLVYDWIAAEWPAIQKKWPNAAMTPVWQVIRFACEDRQRDALDALFVPPSASREGWFGKNAAWYGEQIKEAIRCRDFRDYGSAAVERYLLAYVKGNAH